LHRPTQFHSFPFVNEYLDMTVIFASELNQVTNSFKFRAAWNVVNSIEAKGYLAASSGNFGQALACAAQLKGKRCIVVMPENSASVKIEAVRSYGARVDLIDTSLISRAERVSQLARENPQFYVASAYNCDQVIKGNSSLGREIAQQNFSADMILAPIGGGGLSSGIIVGMCDEGDETPVWGAEPTVANDAFLSLQTGELICNQSEPQTIADGARTVSLGKKNWKILQEGLRGILQVDEKYIFKAIRMFHSLGLRVEPTGGVTLGALLQHQATLKNKIIVVVISGGNVDDAVLKRILQKD
jgi:threonine dehydratase